MNLNSGSKSDLLSKALVSSSQVCSKATYNVAAIQGISAQLRDSLDSTNVGDTFKLMESCAAQGGDKSFDLGDTVVQLTFIVQQLIGDRTIKV